MGTRCDTDEGLHFGAELELMAHGFANVVYDQQGGPRGDTKIFSESMVMVMAQPRRSARGTLGLRAWSRRSRRSGKSGYPLLFQTGETADGKTPLVDRQHPHDFFMELAATYSMPLGDDSSAFVYFGLPGEPALGPPAFMHRFSGMRNPRRRSRITGSTRPTSPSASRRSGVSQGAVKLEGSWFNGREPDEYRWNIETRKFDSWSTRLSYNPRPSCRCRSATAT